jgi:hypothetical protein
LELKELREQFAFTYGSGLQQIETANKAAALTKNADTSQKQHTVRFVNFTAQNCVLHMRVSFSPYYMLNSSKLEKFMYSEKWCIALYANVYTCVQLAISGINLDQINQDTNVAFYPQIVYNLLVHYDAAAIFLHFAVDHFSCMYNETTWYGLYISVRIYAALYSYVERFTRW